MTKQERANFTPESFKNMAKLGIIRAVKDVCPRHEKRLIQRRKHDDVWTEPFCRDCAAERLEVFKKQNAESETANARMVRNADVFERESIIPRNLQAKSLDNFNTDTEAAKEALNAAKRIARNWSKADYKDGNAVFSGGPGVGKSHLALGIAKALNKQFRYYNEQRSVVYMPVASLINKIKNSFDTGSPYNEKLAKEIMTSCDILVLDDLGKESTSGDKIQKATKWVYGILFDIMDSRTHTIITTNFDKKQLRAIYGSALIDRIYAGEKEGYAFPASEKSRR